MKEPKKSVRERAGDRWIVEWEKMKAPTISARRVVLYIVAVVLGWVSYEMARSLIATWVLFPPRDADTAWAMMEGVGGMVAGVTSVILAGIALRGLESLRLTRIEMEERASNEAKLAAIHRLEEIASTIIPDNTRILNGLATSGVTDVFLKKGQEPVFEPETAELDRARTWQKRLPVEVLNNILGLLNRLEAWSVYFTTAVADETVAFEPAAPLLRSWVGQYYAVLIVARAEEDNGLFPNLLKLYSLWSARMDKQQLARLHGDVTDQLERAKARMEEQEEELPTRAQSLNKKTSR